ncbi:MAG: low specificity L-threonine aldolase [Rhodospirillales bacterium]|jgi:threonine aldolase|nr:low specificity L-threonine aldolase [Rhodospirillales bacterium]
MNFASDNVTGAAPEILAAIMQANEGARMAYGEDADSQAIEARIADVFETEADVFLVATGTAANALALSVMTPPWGAVFCHADSHIHRDECGAPEFFAGGARLVPLSGADGKIAPAELSAAADAPGHGVHAVPPAAVSVSQASEWGTVYTPDEIAAVAEAARQRGLKVHMDGARFANALVGLGCAAADITWRAGVDVLSFGATKNGALAAEAVVVFDRALSATLAHRRKRGGHLFSKMRLLAAQFDAYLDGGLWLDLARHANAAAGRLAQGLDDLPGARLVHPVDANETFVELPEPVIAGLLADGFVFHRWGDEQSRTVRLVTAFDTADADVDALLTATRRHAEAQSP